MLRIFPNVPRNAALLVLLLVLIVAAPLVPAERPDFLLELLFDAVLLSGVYSVGPGRHRWPFLMLTVATLGIRWGEIAAGFKGLDVGANSITVVWLVYALSIIVARLFRRSDVNVDTIMGAVVAYLLAAIAFSVLFQIIELQRPGSFSGLPENPNENRFDVSNTMLYFSLVCIATMGYGDVVPVSNLARPLAALEGVFGQFYLAVMIARLVGLHIASSSKSAD